MGTWHVRIAMCIHRKGNMPCPESYIRKRVIFYRYMRGLLLDNYHYFPNEKLILIMDLNEVSSWQKIIIESEMDCILVSIEEVVLCQYWSSVGPLLELYWVSTEAVLAMY